MIRVHIPAPGRKKFTPVLVTGLGLLILAFLLYEFVGSNLVHSRAQRVLVREFSDSLSLQKAPQIKAGDPLGILTIPALKLKVAVLEGTTPSDLERGAGHFRGTVQPGGQGNVVLAGRRTTFGSPFRSLDELAPDDEIVVSTRRGIFSYYVNEIRVVKPGEPDVVTATTDNRLTLVTSHPAFVASSRLAVIAELDGDPVQAPVQGGPVVVGRDEMGLSGDSSAIGPLILLVEFLGVLGVVAFFAYRKRSGRVVYLIAAPILILLVLMVFDQLNRLLPGTL